MQANSKLLQMNQSQLRDFEAKCLDHLAHREAKRIITYLAQYIKDIPTPQPEGEKTEPQN